VYLRKMSGRSLGNLAPLDTVGPRKPRPCSSSEPSRPASPVGHLLSLSRLLDKISDPEALFRKPWSRCAVGRQEGLLLHDHDMEARHAPEFCFSFPARSGNAWPFRCVARRCIRLRPHALRTSTDGRARGMVHHGEGAVGSGQSGWARKQEISGGWLVLAYIPLLGVPFQTSQTRRATWRHSVGFGDDHGPQPGPRAHEKSPRGGFGATRGEEGSPTYFQVEVPSAPSHCRPVRKVKSGASLCTGAGITHTRSIVRDDQPVQRTMRPCRAEKVPCWLGVGATELPMMQE